MKRFWTGAAPLAMAIGLSACVQQSASLPQDVIATIAAQVNTGKLLVTDLQDADWDAHQAVTVGALAASDPLPACLDQVEAETGVTGAAPPNYVPRIGGAISAGVQAYIRAQQLQALTTSGISVPVSCDAVLGKVMRQALAAATKLGIGGLGGLLTGGAAVGLPLPLGRKP